MTRSNVLWIALAFILIADVGSTASAETRTAIPDNKVTFRDGDKMLLVNGDPFFPIGLYYTEKERADPTGKALKELRRIGFNSIFIYAMHCWAKPRPGIIRL